MEIIDLTLTINSSLHHYFEDPKIKLDGIKSIEKDGYSDYLLTTSMHTGTHIDGFAHMLNDRTYISNIPLQNFIGDAVVIDSFDDQIISVNRFKSNDIENKIVILRTNASVNNSFDYYNHHPVITLESANYLVEKKIKALGMNTPSPDHSPYLVHKLLLSNNILLFENLTNLSNLPLNKSIEIIALPLKIEADSSPARIIARIKD